MSQKTEKFKNCETFGCSGKIRTDELGRKYVANHKICADCVVDNMIKTWQNKEQS